MTKKSDLLAIGVHPDDIELCCSGTLLHHQSMGFVVSAVDLTQGELGSRGSGQLRLEESRKASQILGIDNRENLQLPDGFLRKEKSALIKLIQVIRQLRPTVVLGNAIRDRHPDHGRAASFIQEACFLSGLVKISTEVDGVAQSPWRPQGLYHYIQDYYLPPDLIVDITPHFDKKLECILAYSSQFYDPESKEVETPISSRAFLDGIEARCREFGRLIGVEYAEGFTTNRAVGVSDLTTLL